MSTKTKTKTKTTIKSGKSKRQKRLATKQTEPAKKPAAKKQSAESGLAVLKANPKSVETFALKHTNNSYQKQDGFFTDQLSRVHVYARVLNNAGLQATISLADFLAACAKHLGNSVYICDSLGQPVKPVQASGHCARWLTQQSGGAGIGGIKIKNPKISIAANGKITVLRLFKSRGNRSLG